MPTPLTILFHGSYGNPAANWFPWLRKELGLRGLETVALRYPTPENQSLENWMRVFVEQPLSQERSLILIGHSLGATFTLRLLERIRLPVLATFLVAGSVEHLDNPQFYQPMSTFVDPPFDWVKIKEAAGIIRLYHSPDDPIVPISRGRTLERQLGVPLIEVPDAGHFLSESGYSSFEILRNHLVEIIEGRGLR